MKSETSMKDILTLSLAVLVIRGIATESEIEEAKNNGYDGLYNLLNKKYYETEIVK